MINPQKEQIDFYLYLKEIKRLAERSIDTYWKYYRHIDPNAISEEYIEDFVLKHGNVFAVRGFLKSYLEFRKLHKKIDLPPKATGSKPTRIPREISAEEIQKLRFSIYNKSFRNGLIFDLAYQGALRRAEIPTIRINSFKWREWTDNMNGFCKLIVLGKRNKERVVLINPETAQIILEHYAEKYSIKTAQDLEEFYISNAYLFADENNEPISDKIVYYVIKRESMRFLGRDIRPHELRFHRAVELDKKGVPIRDIKVYLGHVNLTTTEIYLRNSDNNSIANIDSILTEQELN